MFSENEFSNLSIRKFNQTHVYIVDDHQFVLPIWAYYSLSKNVKYSLLTFDFHTDTRQAFTKYACVQNSGKPFKDVNNFRKNHMKEINRNDLKSICIETNNLANDEHIRAAMEFGFIQHPHVITVDKTYSDPDINYYKIDNIQDIVEIKETDDPYQGDLPFLRKLYLNRLEDDYIRSTGFKACKLTEPYILDFDLDYFPSRESLHPQKRSIVNFLISNAKHITIAREKTYFERNCKQTGFTAREAESLLLELVEAVLKNRHY